MSKQFIVDRHTTPGTPTLDPVAIPKVPVYDTVADAEADLRNLAVGQIVATEDTGAELANPVDAVAAGNMHAVTSNAVADALSYSTTEKLTGGTWIDGKPIYRKVINNLNVTLTSNTWTDTGVSNSGYAAILDIKCLNNDGAIFKYIGCAIDLGNTIKILSTRNADTLINKLIIEYIKTTD